MTEHAITIASAGKRDTTMLVAGVSPVYAAGAMWSWKTPIGSLTLWLNHEDLSYTCVFWPPGWGPGGITLMNERLRLATKEDAVAEVDKQVRLFMKIFKVV